MQITYTNKEALQNDPEVADKNKVTAEDMNEIKTVVNTNEEELSAYIADLESNQLTGQAIGTSIDLSDSADSRVRSIELEGNSEQESTTGKNLANTSAIAAITHNGVKFTPIYENGLLKYIEANGTATATAYIDIASAIYDAGSYILNGSPANGSIDSYRQLMVRRNDFTQIGADNGNGVTITLDGTNIYFIRCRIAEGYTANNIKFYPMIRLASVTDGTYEPYTGGIASPNPSYPQEIHSTGDNANELDISNMQTGTKTGITVSKNDSTGEITISGTATAYTAFNIPTNLSGTNTYSCDNWGSFTLYLQNDGTGVGSATSNTSYNGNVNNIVLAISNGVTINKTIKLKVEKGTVASPYTPYGVGSVNEKVQNKNLININNWVKGRINNSTGEIEYANNTTAMTISNNSITFTVSQAWNSGIASDFIPITPGEYYFKYSHDKKVTVYADTYNSQKERISRIMSYTEDSSPTTRILTISDSSIRYIRIHFEVSTVGTYVVSDMQLEQGTTATDYVAHEEQNISIPCQQPMRAIGEYKDTFVKVDGNWHERHYIGQVVLDGSESGWEYQSSYQRFKIPLSAEAMTSERSNSKSNYFIYGNTETTNGTFFIATNNVLLIRNEEYTSVADLKTWLSNNNVEVIYVLATPVDLPCTEEQVEALEALEKVRTYKPVTHISSEDTVPATIDLTYVKDLETVINEISSAIVAQGGV